MCQPGTGETGIAINIDLAISLGIVPVLYTLCLQSFLLCFLLQSLLLLLSFFMTTSSLPIFHFLYSLLYSLGALWAKALVPMLRFALGSSSLCWSCEWRVWTEFSGKMNLCNFLLRYRGSCVFKAR